MWRSRRPRPARRPLQPECREAVHRSEGDPGRPGLLGGNKSVISAAGVDFWGPGGEGSSGARRASVLQSGASLRDELGPDLEHRAPKDWGPDQTVEPDPLQTPQRKIRC